MPAPGENFVLRLFEGQPNLVHMNVLDLGVAGVADTVALVEWAYSASAAPIVSVAGFSVMRFDITGKLLWQVSRTLCALPNVECGQWEIEGGLARTPNGFIVAGSGININDTARKPLMFAMRIDDAGALLWARTYAPTGPTLYPGRITSIAPMNLPDHYLIAAFNSVDETWLFVIDGSGVVKNSAIAPVMRVRRLRATPTQGICAIGESNPDGTPDPAILNIDPMTLAPRWWRSYTYGLSGFLFGVRWYDIAEGDRSLLVAGNLVSNVTELAQSPLLAFVATDTAAPPAVGEVRSAFLPAMGADPIHLRGVASFVEEIVPLAPGDRKARFAVTGDVKQQPWQFVIDEDGVIEWQKRYRTTGADTGKLAPTAWPAFQHILAGGSVTTGGSRSRGFLTSSPVIAPGGEKHCSTEINVTFPDHVLYSHAMTPRFEPITITAGECYHEQGPLLTVKKECLDAQG
jgi:hypothetical protein